MIVLRDVRGQAARTWLEYAYKEWLLEIGASDAEVVAARTTLDAMLVADDTATLLIERAGQPAGFAMVRTLPAVPGIAPAGVAMRRLEDFFVVSEFRRLGVGAAAARLLFERFDGSWEIVTLQRHEPSICFWRAVLQGYTAGRVTERRLAGEIRYLFASNGAK